MAFNQSKFNEILKRCEPDIVAGFEHLHAHPELSLQEFKTTQYIKETLSALGIEILDLGLETGVVALLRGNHAGPCIGLRADIDALPVQELADCPYRSKTDGLMHACGHDTHTAALLGAAKVLLEMKEDLHGSVKFLFQPAEEVNQGARIMIDKGAMKNPKVDMVFGIHNQPEIPVGQVGVKSGGLMAAVDRFNIIVHGKGGHGGVPYKTIDPIVASAAIINSLQHIVSRKANPKDTCVVSVCSMHAGTGMTYNVIPEEVNMVGTVRTYDKELGASVEGMMRNIITNVAAAHSCTAELEYIYDLPAVLNPDSLVPIALQSVAAVQSSMGQTQACDPTPSTGGEDFTFFMQEAPGFFYWLGVANPERKENHSWHNPYFLADERAIIIGSGVYAASVFYAIEALKKA